MTQRQDAESLEPLADFAMLGVRRSVRLALHEAFPAIRTPTACQTAFIPAILGRKDVILKDWTGTGKSFGLILALLSKARATRPQMSYKERTSLAKRPITSLVVVPHRDLAYQLMHWIRMLCPHNHEASLDSVAQVCVRGNTASPLNVQIRKLREQAPHILIGTPQALVEIMETDRAALQIPTLDTVVVDEVDYLLPVPPQGASKKDKRKWEAHPPPTLKLLNALFADRSKIKRMENSMSWRFPLQAVFASATLRHYLRRFLFGETIWMDRYSEVVKIDFEREGKKDDVGMVKHYALVVDKQGAVRNLDIPQEVHEPMEGDQLRKLSKPLKKSKPGKMVYYAADEVISPMLLEAIATTSALDVPKIALLVLPAAAPVNAVLKELQELGIDARSLGLQDEDRGKPELMRSTLKKFNRIPQRHKSHSGEVDNEEASPSLLVTTAAAIRGLDLPELTHVFLACVPGDAVDYEHAAGRVGRFGREGKVVMFVRPREDEAVYELYQKLDIRASQFEHVQI
ncbi:P-loop containing nucleoside triphosphate hydrolase protein [Ramaria rubella]|nr:P-loop containing nucleoside triphosphate hydrolase protein [Ramaria rubella]